MLEDLKTILYWPAFDSSSSSENMAILFSELKQQQLQNANTQYK